MIHDGDLVNWLIRMSMAIVADGFIGILAYYPHRSSGVGA